MSVKTLIRKPRLWLIAGVVLLVITGALWCYKSCMEPERVFWGMIEQSLATTGVAVEVTQANAQSSAHQMVQYSFGAANLSRSVTTLSQPGTTVKNESIGTPTNDYTRYVSVETTQKSASGKDMDFSSILGVWAQGQGEGPGQLFSQAALGTGLPLGGLAVPIANLNATSRERLVNQIRNDNLYQTTFKKVKKSTKNGRLQYTYAVKMQPVAYAGMMKRFGSFVGLHDLDQVDPASFTGQPAFDLNFTVDVRTRQLVRVQTSNGAIDQRYTGYNVPVNIVLPTKAIPFATLQERLTKVQQ